MSDELLITALGHLTNYVRTTSMQLAQGEFNGHVSINGMGRQAAKRIKELNLENDRLRLAVEAIVEWDKAERSAPPYDSDHGRHFGFRFALCGKAFELAWKALGVERAW